MRYNYEEMAMQLEFILPHSLHAFFTAYHVVSELPAGMLSRQEERDLLLAALLHDIGKSLWPDNWHVDPKYKLGTNALTVMQAHPLAGANMAYEAGIPESVVDIIRQHHERPGGKGYPLKVEPSLPALMLAACDVYAAATENRKYRKRPLTHEEALKEVAKFAPPEVVKILARRVQKKQTG
jgi:putative nucleotidyltransferase with HDIG domain